MDFRMDAVGIVVSDLNKSMAFYRRLGCEWPVDAGGMHADCDLGGFRLMLDTEDVLRGLGWDHDPDNPRTALSLAVRCIDPAAVNALYSELEEDGFGFREPFDAPWGQRYATVQDPDGTHISLYAEHVK